MTPRGDTRQAAHHPQPVGVVRLLESWSRTIPFHSPGGLLWVRCLYIEETRASAAQCGEGLLWQRRPEAPLCPVEEMALRCLGLNSRWCLGGWGHPRGTPARLLGPWTQPLSLLLWGLSAEAGSGNQNQAVCRGPAQPTLLGYKRRELMRAPSAAGSWDFPPRGACRPRRAAGSQEAPRDEDLGDPTPSRWYCFGPCRALPEPAAQ